MNSRKMEAVRLGSECQTELKVCESLRPSAFLRDVERDEGSPDLSRKASAAIVLCMAVVSSAIHGCLCKESK